MLCVVQLNLVFKEVTNLIADFIFVSATETLFFSLSKTGCKKLKYIFLYAILESILVQGGHIS